MTDDFKNLWVKDQEDSFPERWVKYWKAPASPVPEEIEFLREFIKTKQTENPDLQVMILGSTSEYCDLMFEFNIKPTVVDLSKENHEILSKRMTHYNEYKENEEFLEQKWQEIKTDKKYDLVIAHFALTVNPFDLWDDIFRSIHAVLNAGGIFITNNWIKAESQPKIEDIIKEYNEKWQGKYSLFGSMMPKIYLASQNPETDEIPFTSVCRLVDDAYSEKLVLEEDYQIYQDMAYRNFKFSMFISSEEKFKNYLEPYFSVKDRVILNPYPNAALMPEWVLAKK